MSQRKINNKRITPRLFSNKILEKLSHVHPIVPVIIYVPVAGYFLARAAMVESLSTSIIISLFTAGFVFWTFAEYILHRYVFHFEFHSKLGEKVHFLIHGIHHDYPRDPLRLVMPPAVSIPLAILFYGLFWLTIGATYTPAFFAGFIIGYLAYDIIHYAVHHYSLRNNRILLWLKQHHLRHHYQDEENGFGVSSPLWDYVLKTLPIKSKQSSNR